MTTSGKDWYAPGLAVLVAVVLALKLGHTLWTGRAELRNLTVTREENPVGYWIITLIIAAFFAMSAVIAFALTAGGA